MLFPAQMILRLFESNEFKVILITGDHGYGKSSYANRILSEVYSEDSIHGNWEIKLFEGTKHEDGTIKEHGHLGFHPGYVVDQWLGMRKRDKCYHWDDSGLWLNAMDYQDPFIISVGKYLQVARTDWACLLFSCIDKEDVFAKLRNLRNAIVVEITKNSDKQHPYRRVATAYKYWKSKSGSKKGIKNLWKEEFNCYVPDRFYNWYEPRRANYAYLAKQQMKDFLYKKHPDLMKYLEQLDM